MASIKLKVISARGETLAASGAGERVSVVHTAAYAPGDQIIIDTDTPGLFCMVHLEDSMLPALLYIKGTTAEFPIPPADNRPNYSPKSFTGTCHLITARVALPEETAQRRLLSFNPYDTHGDHGFYPHAYANVETRGEAVFAARNAIDGIFENVSHGVYPYQSWGINRDPNAQLTLEFGREVVADEVRLTLRADFPHDNYWIKATVAFSDASSETFSLIQTDRPQCFPIAPRTISSLTLKDLIPSPGPSPFPALTQIEIYGTERP